MTDLQINEICRAYVLGVSVDSISEAEECSVQEIENILSDNEGLVHQLKDYYDKVKEEV